MPSRRLLLLALLFASAAVTGCADRTEETTAPETDAATEQETMAFDAATATEEPTTVNVEEPAPSEAGAQAEQATAAKGRQWIYKDRNGYFVAVPPAGWTQKDYPSETVRSKVAFVSTDDSFVLIRIIAGPIPRPSYTLDDLYEEGKQQIATVLRPRFPSVTINLTKEKVHGLDAIVWMNSGPPVGVQKRVQYVKGNLWYQVSITTKTRTEFDKYHSTFERFLSGFVLLDKRGEFSEQDAKGAIVSRYRRIAELYEEMGRMDEAIVFLNEGLSIVPDSRELLDYKQRLTTSRYKKPKN